MLEEYYAHLNRPGASFGNHRKYESLQGLAANGTGEVVASYVRWIAQTIAICN
jgi:hypothetical protein